MNKILVITLLSLVLQTTAAQTLVLRNSRTVNHQALQSIKLSLVPPSGYVTLPDDRGFFKQGSHPENGDPQIVVAKFLVDFAYLRQSLDTVSNTTGKTEVDLVLDNTKHFNGLWFKKVYEINGSLVTSLTLAFGNTFYAYLVTGFFNSTNAATESDIQQAMRSAYIDMAGYTTASSSRTTTLVATRGQHVNISGTPFKVAEQPTDDWTIYTLDGNYPPQVSDHSQFQVNRNSALVSGAFQLSYSTDLLNANSGLTGLSNIHHSLVNIDGLSGIEITADAKSTESGNPDVSVIQLTLFDSALQNVWVIAGVSYRTDPNMIPAIRSISATFKK